MIRMMKGGNYRNIDDKLVCVFDVVNVNQIEISCLSYNYVLLRYILKSCHDAFNVHLRMTCQVTYH